MPEAVDFSLLSGGFQYRLMRRIGLADRLVPRAVVLSALSWLPLVILSALQGALIDSNNRIPLLGDFATYGRFLIAVPILVLTEKLVNRRIQDILQQFFTSKLIKDEEESAFLSAIQIADRQKDSFIAEILMIGIAYTLVFIQIQVVTLNPASVWYLQEETLDRLSPAGWWYALVSIPISQFLLFRWLWRLIIWTGLLWRISKLDLRLVPVHPDHAGGLGFLPLAQVPFALIAFAGNTVISSAMLNSIIYRGTNILSYAPVVIASVILSVLIFLAPLFVFIRKLICLRVRGTFDYTALSEGYVLLFNEKWIKGKNPKGESILGTTDIQSLADLANSFDIIRSIKAVPIDYNVVTIIAVASVLPMLPLILMVLPFSEIIKRLLGLAG